jgi:lipopolysaccharide biosynthesis regulator YciM
MGELLWLLIPLAAISGWYAASLSYRRQAEQSASLIPDEYIKGLNFLLNEQPDKALEVFIRIVEVDPDTIETQIALGNLFRRRGEADRAIRMHQNLVARSNLSFNLRANALLELGRDYLRAGLLDRAESILKEVVQIGGQTAQAYKHLREIYEQEKDWMNAIETAVHLQNECGLPQGEVIAHYYCELGECALAHGQYDVAFQHAKKALTYDRACARASILLGDLAFGQGNYKAAIKFFSDVHVQRHEFISLVLPKLKEAYARQGDNKGYLTLLQRISEDNGGMSVVLSMIESLGRDDATVDEIFAAEFKRPSVPLRMIRVYVQIKSETGERTSASLTRIVAALDSHLERQASHLCHRCGLETKALFWQCPSCHGWGTIKPIDVGHEDQRWSRSRDSMKHLPV